MTAALLVAAAVWLLASALLAAYGLGYHNNRRPARASLPRRTPGSSLVWLPDNPYSPVTEAGDRAALAVLLRQKARDEKYRGRPRHAAWLTEDLTGEYALVETTYEKEVAA